MNCLSARDELLPSEYRVITSRKEEEKQFFLFLLCVCGCVCV